jgi:hypothetical protein
MTIHPASADETLISDDGKGIQVKIDKKTIGKVFFFITIT